ncbi:MAG TPA: spermidine/putrescine ABC transporter substrate-binding protein [Capillimicrobium sp.]|nr:spermidine/putrescine ABC transporter substrate-binding protein [Capillimicrobium sp.]
MATVLALGAMAAGVAACGAEVETSDTTSGGAETTASEPTGSGDGTLTISNWDAYTPKGLIPGFEKETGVKVKLAKHATNEDIMGKLEASGGSGYDIVFVSGQFAEALHKRGWAAEIDHSKIPNLKNLYPEANELPYDPGNQYSVPYTWGTTGICYRSDLVPEKPTSWNDLLDPAPENEGKVTMLATDRWLMLPALKALGYSANTTDEGELEEARDLLLKTKDQLLAYDDTTFYSKLVSGEANLVEAWDGWCNYGIAEDDRIEFVVPEEGSDLWADTMVVLESSPNKDEAFEFINYVLRPESGQGIVDLLTYNTPNQAAMEQLDPKLKKQFPNLGIPPETLLEQENLRDLGDAQPTWTRIVTEITS